MTEEKIDLYAQVTQRIIADLEKGVRPWQQLWANGKSTASLPVRANGICYRGINVLLLWAESVAKGYVSPLWITYDQAKFQGGHVRKGERGTMIVFASARDDTGKSDAGEAKERQPPILKRYTLFNVDQIDRLPTEFIPQNPRPASQPERIEATADFIRATGAIVKHGAGKALYSPSHDRIQIPKPDRFENKEVYYATLLRELTHWTQHKTRLDRDFGQEKAGDTGHATEELVAELGSAFLCAELGIIPAIREDHAAYIGPWLTILRENHLTIFRAAAHAQRAADYLKRLQPKPASTPDQTAAERVDDNPSDAEAARPSSNASMAEAAVSAPPNP